MDDGDARTTWLLDRYDVPARRIVYVCFQPSVLTRISIGVEPAGSDSIATVTYAKTILDEGARGAVDRFVAHFSAQAPHWEEALNAELARSKER